MNGGKKTKLIHGEELQNASLWIWVLCVMFSFPTTLGAEWLWTNEQAIQEQASASPSSTVCRWWRTQCKQIWDHTPGVSPAAPQGTASEREPGARVASPLPTIPTRARAWDCSKGTPVWLTLGRERGPLLHGEDTWAGVQGWERLGWSFLTIKTLTTLAFWQTQTQQNVVPSVTEMKSWLSFLN